MWLEVILLYQATGVWISMVQRLCFKACASEVVCFRGLSVVHEFYYALLNLQFWVSVPREAVKYLTLDSRSNEPKCKNITHFVVTSLCASVKRLHSRGCVP